MKIIAHTETGVLAQLDKDEFGAIALRESYTSLKQRHGIAPDDYESHPPGSAEFLTGDMALKATADNWRPPAGTEFFLRLDLSDAIGNLRHNLAQLERVHILTRGQKPEPVHPVDAIVAMFGMGAVKPAFEDVVRYGAGTLQLLLSRPLDQPIGDLLDVTLTYIPYQDTIAQVVDAGKPEDFPDAELIPMPPPPYRLGAVSRKEVNARLRLKHPLKGLKATDPDLYSAVKSALAKRGAASRRKPSHL